MTAGSWVKDPGREPADGTEVQLQGTGYECGGTQEGAPFPSQLLG